MFTPLSSVLPRVLSLFEISKLPAAQRKTPTLQLISEHEQAEGFNPGWLEETNEKIHMVRVRLGTY